MTAETGRRASRLELIRARLHESGRRCARDADVTTRTSTAVRDVRPTGRDISHTTHNGVRPGLRAADPDRRGSRADTKPDRKVQSGNMDHDRQQQVPVGHQTEVKGRWKLDVGVDRQEYTQVRKPAPASSGPVDRAQASVEGRLTPGQNDSTTSGSRRLAQKTSSSSSLLSKSQNFFARLRNRKNDPSKATKSVCRDGGSGNNAESNRKIRRSISESGCAMYANRELVVGNSENSVDVSLSSAHLDVVTSSDDVRTERQTVNRPEVVDNNAVAKSAKDHVTTTSVYVEVEPLTSSVLTLQDVTLPTESTSGSGQIGSCPTSIAVYEECSGSYSLREALLQRGGGDAAVADTPTSSDVTHVIRQVSATSSPQSDDDRVPLRKAQTSSVLPVGGAISDGCRSVSVAGWRRRKLATTHSTGCLLGGRREGRLERIQEVDSPPGSADNNEMSLRSATAAESVVTDQRVGPDATQRSSDARNCKFDHASCI